MCVASLCDQSEVRAGWKMKCASKKVCDVCKQQCDQPEVRAGWKMKCASKKVCDVCKQQCDQPEVRAGWKIQCASKKCVMCVSSSVINQKSELVGK